MLTDEQIEKFREIYIKRFNQEISREFAIDVGTRLVTMMRVVYKPLPKLQVQDKESQMISVMEK
jgi:hypothetical protein